MTCREFKLRGFDRPVFVHHNEDWSGVAIVEWWEDKFMRAEVPARVILLLSFAVTKHWILPNLEANNEGRSNNE